MENKPKKILITYFNSQDISSIGAREAMFQKVVKDLASEGKKTAGRQMSSPQLRKEFFTDGSVIYFAPIAQIEADEKFTHIFVDKSIMSTKNGVDFVKNSIMTKVNFNTEKKQINFFSLENGKLIVTTEGE
ncbi:hypothetical protein MOD25_06145 [Bacillus haynesii]|uniref:hypothetical protein n=1 Tax=Bacillus haynesii TaxID=1925021 RepID=UPI00228117C8|nr:hypothetical protein [Bacillus haynesii]MCY8549485.1 hypothetical protein [Bacillus haynesii]